jgi:hypothetical protein
MEILFVTYDQVKPLQDRVRSLIVDAKKVGNMFDRPNGHSLIELVLRQLPLLQNCVFARTNTQERHHRWGKLNTLSKAVDKAAKTMAQYNHHVTCAFMSNGGKWGDNMQYKASAAFRSLSGETDLIMKVS